MVAWDSLFCYVIVKYNFLSYVVKIGLNSNKTGSCSFFYILHKNLSSLYRVQVLKGTRF